MRWSNPWLPFRISTSAPRGNKLASSQATWRDQTRALLRLCANERFKTESISFKFKISNATKQAEKKSKNHLSHRSLRVPCFQKSCKLRRRTSSTPPSQRAALETSLRKIKISSLLSPKFKSAEMNLKIQSSRISYSTKARIRFLRSVHSGAPQNLAVRIKGRNSPLRLQLKDHKCWSVIWRISRAQPKKLLKRLRKSYWTAQCQ